MRRPKCQEWPGRVGIFRYLLKAVYSLFILMTLGGKSQSVPGNDNYKWRLSAGVLLDRSAVIDEKFSAASYSAIIPGGMIDIRHKSARAMHDVAVVFSTGKLGSSAAPSYTTAQSALTVDYSVLYRIAKSSNGMFACRVGGGLQFSYNERSFNDFVNSTPSFETLASMGPVADFSYRVTGFTLSDRITLPVLFSFSQSPYTSLPGTGSSGNKSGVGYFFDSNRWVLAPELFRIKNSFVMTREINDKQSVSVSYNWQFYKIKGRQAVLQANHQLAVLYSYKL